MTGCAGTNTALTVAMLIKQSQNLETEDTATAEVSADDIRSGYFIIDGVTYKLPLDCQEFLNRGWVLAANSEAQLEPGDYLNTKLKKGDGVLSIKIGNSGDEKKTITSLPIIEMSIDLTWDPEAPTSSSPRPDEQEKTLPTVELPKGVVLLTGKKTDVIEATKNGSNRGIEDIIDTYGEDDISKMPWPSPYIEDEYGYVNPTDNSSIIFSMSYVAFNADPTTKRHISSVTIVNDSAFVNKRTQIMEAGAEIAEPTTEVAAYQIPAELGTDITSGIIELEGDLYQLPAPASAYQKNGWKPEVKFPAELEPGDNAWVFLFRDGKQFGVWIYNKGTETTAHSNCYILGINSSNFSNDGTLKLPGIAAGDSRIVLENVLEGIEYKYRPFESLEGEIRSREPDADRYEVKLDSGVSIAFSVSNITDRVRYFYIGKDTLN